MRKKMSNVKPKFVVCQYIKIYNDLGFKEGGGFKETGISVCECKAYMNEKDTCPNNGRCIIAKDPDTWKQITKKSFNKGEKNVKQKATQ